VKLGRGDCNECGGKATKQLIVDRRGVWSKCNRCQLMEWEWQTGDPLSYLKYLAERYNVTAEQILEALAQVAEQLYR